MTKGANNPIAIVGMACEFPGAHSPEELWENVLAGRRSFRKAPPERLPPDYFDPDPEAPGKSYTDQMAVLTGWSFDPLEFRIPPVTFQATDIAHWLALYTARQALRNARLRLDSLNRARVGVVLGNSLTGEFSRSHNLRFRWPYVERSLRRALARPDLGEAELAKMVQAVREVYEAPLPDITEDSLAGNMANTIAGRICNYFDFGGGGFTVDGACSSSLLSVVTACNALAGGELDFALAGGVDVSLDPFEIVGFAKTKALATDDIRPYDERGQGMLTGEGCGIAVLAREADARAAGLPVRALLRGWGYSSDGTASGITAPEVEGQMRALRRAYERAGYDIGTVGCFEGHGTGTALGDKVELTAIRRLLEEAPGDTTCWIGSIKANIGHCKAAAGIAGLIKAVMALERRIIPPTVNCVRPNAAFGSPLHRLRPSLGGHAWEPGETPRRASVSSMGFGGANAHVTLEEADPNGAASPEELAWLASAQTTELIPLAADSLPELQRRVEQLLPLTRRLSRAELTDLSAALSRTPPQGRLRLALVADSPWALAASLQTCADNLAEARGMAALDGPADGIFASQARENPSWVALLPGQGSQRLNMAEPWLRRFPFVRESCDRVMQCPGAPGVVRSLRQTVLRDVLGADEATRKAWETELRDTRVAQPAIVLASLAGMRVLDFFGLRPTFVIGHSLGEITALAAAGVCEPPQAVRLAAWRGEAMASLPARDAGRMAAVAAPAELVRQLIAPWSPALVISNYNSPKQTVVSGASDAVEQLARVCEDRKIPCRFLPVSHAFHSDIVAPAAEALRERLGGGKDDSGLKIHGFRLASGWAEGGDLDHRATMISTVTGQPMSAEVDWPEYLANQIRQPVRFTDAVLSAAEHRPALWLEVGPGGVLTRFVRDIFGAVTVPCLPTDLADEDGFHLLNQALARAWVLGFPVKLERLFEHRFHRPFDPDHFQPKFIVNPCERPVDLGPRGTPAAVAARAEPAGPAPDSREGLLGFAVQWIARRTGFPPSALTPDKRLRDDLNLDSIKVGELVVLLTRKLGRRFDADPASVANARIAALVDAVLGKSHPPEDTARAAVSAPSGAPADGLAEWVRTFHMTRVPRPLDAAARVPLPASGAAVVLGEPSSPRACAIEDRLGSLGLAAQAMDLEAALRTGDAPPDLAVLVVVLPEANEPFFASDPAGFDQRVEGLATRLFQAFRWAGHGTDAARLRGLVLRPVSGPSDAAGDLDGGAGFLKSLGLEFPGANFKWLALPGGWTAERWAEVVLEELQAPCDRVGFVYTSDGQRWAEVAEDSARPAVPTAPVVGPSDVVLVSGGAKGITCELALALAQRTGVKLALLGSSPLPDASADPQQDELLRNLRRFDELGLAHVYLQADVTNLGDVRSAAEEAERLLGPVTAILHGAGVTELRLFRDKPLEEFLRCVRVKARGLFNLLQAVPPARLKALHVVSSVLGHTGMRGQADYTLANAWLDGAVAAVKEAHPRVHCLSLGFTAWADTGLARKVGAVDSLRAAGVTPLRSDEGVAAYLELAGRPEANGAFVITGRLSGELEPMLFAPTGPAAGRFLEQVRRWVPGVELVADASLSHAADLYLPEHVFDGTPVFPGVMALEAMAQAARVCAGREELPALRNVRFNRPLIVPEDGAVVMRTLALARPSPNGEVCVRVAIRSDRAGFQQNHFEAECLFGVVDAPTPQALEAFAIHDLRFASGEREADAATEDAPRAAHASLPAPTGLDPEAFSPVPLFQGKFFRRITAIRRLEMESESLTEIRVPEGERYFGQGTSSFPLSGKRGGVKGETIMPSPAARDAFLQSGALILPPGCLPTHLGALRVWSRATPGERVFCAAKVRSRSAGEFVVDLVVFDPQGRVLELLTGLHLKQAGAGLAARPPAPPVPLARLAGDLRALLPEAPLGLALVSHDELATGRLTEVSGAERKQLWRETPAPRRLSRLGNLVATRRALVALCEPPSNAPRASGRVRLASRPDGKPELRFEGSEPVLGGLEVSLADAGGWSVAAVGLAPMGVDLEFVAPRDAETWRGLLGDDGYALALRVAAQSVEPFDRAATRVWTLLEAGKKAAGLQRIVPGFDSSVGGPWLAFSGAAGPAPLEFLCAAVELPAPQPAVAVLTLARGTFPTGRLAVLAATGPEEGPQARFASVVSGFTDELSRLKPLSEHDPEAPGCEERHAQFVAAIEQAYRGFRDLGRTTGAAELAAMRRRFQEALLPFLDGSENFRHTLVKPLGYAGDFQLLDMLARNTCASRGLAWHFDRSQLDYPASEACRRRIEWISGELAADLAGRPAPRLRILDLGVGAAPVERRLVRQVPGLSLELDAVDLEPAALEYLRGVFAAGAHVVHPWRLNLRDPAVLSQVAELAARAHVCIAIGMLEALTDAEAGRLLRAVLGALPPGAVLYTENFVPDHPTRSIMEWFQDFHLCYRSADELRALAQAAGADPARLQLTLDATGSLALLKALR